jgi:hypothetical protein
MLIYKPTSFDEFIKLLNQLKNSGDCYYRGQSNSSWPITCGLARHNDKEVIENILKVEKIISAIFKEQIADKNLCNLIPIADNNYHKSWQWLMAAQHYGLPTRLLDFSFDKYTALQFAVADFQYLNSDGTLIICCNVVSKQEDIDSEMFKKEFESLDHSFFFQTPIYYKSTNNGEKLSERRKFIQGSKFLYRGTSTIKQCLALDEKFSQDLIKIQIKKELKLDIIKHLIEIGKFAFDIYSGRNDIDNYAATIKNEFMNLNENNLDSFLHK